MNREKSIKEVVSLRLKMARETAGLSQNQVAKMLGLKRPAISEIEAGRRKVSADEIAKLAEYYDVDVSWLLNTKIAEFNEVQEKVELAARELNKLNPKDVDRLLNVLSAIKSEDKKD